MSKFLDAYGEFSFGGHRHHKKKKRRAPPAPPSSDDSGGGDDSGGSPDDGSSDDASDAGFEGGFHTMGKSHFLDCGYDTESSRSYRGGSKGGTDFGIGVVIPSQYGHRDIDGSDDDYEGAGMEYPGGNPNTPLGRPAEFAADDTPAATAAVAAPPVVPKHHGNPVLKSVGVGALVGGIVTAAKLGAMAASGAGLAAAGLTYLVSHHGKKK
jgi:hypothetical protein